MLVALLAALTGWYVVRNPESRRLDAQVRDSAGGSYATLSDGITHYQVSGPADGTPVVLVHGFSVPSYIWDSTAISLSAAGYRVLQYDLFGRGLSDRPDASYDVDFFDLQLMELTEATGFSGSFHLMGLSFGGLVTGTFAGRHPDRVRSLTLMDPVAEDRGELPWAFRLPFIGPLLWQALVVPTMAGGQMIDFLEPGKWPDWIDRYQPQVQFRGFGRALRASIQASAGIAMDSVYGAVGQQTMPVQLIWGANDRTVPTELSSIVRAAIPRTEYHPIPGAAHLPHMERADLVNPLLLNFLRAADSAPSP